MENQIKKYTNDLINQSVCESSFPMNSLQLIIPISYIINLVPLDWDDIHFAIINGYINVYDIIEFAIKMLETNPDNEIISEIASLSHKDALVDEKITCSVNKLLKDSDISQIKSKFLYVILSYVFDKRYFFEDPFTAVEVVYADFDYPETIKKFVRFMPKNRFNFKKNIIESEYMFAEWKKFLEQEQERYRRTH